MSSCLSCSELEEKICTLSEEIAASSCEVVIKEGDTEIDKTSGLKAKVEVLKTYQRMFETKNCGSSDELFEFVHVPCITPHTCKSRVCTAVPRIRNQRRYR
jgi:hypothetical protein